MSYYLTYNPVIKTFKDRRVFLLAGGPSLQHFDYNKIKDELTIGVNKSFIDFPVTINYTMDFNFYKYLTFVDPGDRRRCEIQQIWKNYSGIKLFLIDAIDKESRKKSDIYLVNKVKDKLSFDALYGIYPGNNAGFGALMLAVALGCTKIGLLGYDMKLQGEKTHYHDGYFNQNPSIMKRRLEKFKEPFNRYSDVLKSQNIDVVNLNPDSALTCFRKDTIDSFLSN